MFGTRITIFRGCLHNNCTTFIMPWQVNKNVAFTENKLWAPFWRKMVQIKSNVKTKPPAAFTCTWNRNVNLNPVQLSLWTRTDVKFASLSRDRIQSLDELVQGMKFVPVSYEHRCSHFPLIIGNSYREMTDIVKSIVRCQLLYRFHRSFHKFPP